MIDIKNILPFILLCLFLVLPSKAQSERDFEIKSVRFEENQAYTDDRLLNVMVNRPSSFLNTSKFRPQVFEQDLKNISLFYRNRGYLEAQVADYQVLKDTTEMEIEIVIQISEGQQTMVGSVSLLGNEFFSDEQLQKYVKINAEDPLFQEKINTTTLDLLQLYANDGFLDAEVKPDVRVKEENHLALVDFVITEGIQYIIDEIEIIGLEKTEPHVVKRELKFDTDDILNYSKLLESQRKLYQTGLFQGVFIKPDSVIKNKRKRDVIVEVKENVPAEFNVAVGYATIERFRGKLEIFTTNLRGNAQKLGLLTKASFINRKLQGSFTEPWTFGFPWQTDLNAKWEFLEEPSFELHRVVGQLSIGREFLRRSNLTLTFRAENATLSNVKTKNIPRDLTNDVRSLKLSLVYDTRNDLFNATRGLYVNLGSEFAGNFLRSTASFSRLTSEFKYFYPWTPNRILGTSLNTGLIYAKGGVDAIPLNERFFTGGPNSIRGFDYQEVGSVDESGIPVGGRLKIVWNVFEIRQTIYKMFGMVLFADVGNVWQSPEHFNLRDFRSAVGTGVRVNTPIGMLRLDFGINIDPQPDEPKTKLYIGMGQTF